MIAMDLIMVLCYATNEEAKGKINANGEREKCKCGYENKQSREKKERNETRNMQNATPFHRLQGQKGENVLTALYANNIEFYKIEILHAHSDAVTTIHVYTGSAPIYIGGGFIYSVCCDGFVAFN